MGKIGAFKIIPPSPPPERPIEERVRDYREIHAPFGETQLREQTARCMNCGVPFCNNGCPLGNLIPDWNESVYRGRFKEALDLLLATNNFPEFTGRICPAPCEESCVLNLEQRPVTIKGIEESIIERAFSEGWMTSVIPSRRTGHNIAVIGSGPAGLACAAQLNSAGHVVTVFERADRIGGLLTYGIPGFKLEKQIVERRVGLLKQEGIRFVTSACIGTTPTVAELLGSFDAVVLCCGSTKARELDLPGRELSGIHLAMDYLTQQNRSDFGDQIPAVDRISASGKRVIILGGGDTGADCLGTAIRQGAASVHQFELMPEPPRERTQEMPWPVWPMLLRQSAAHDEADAIRPAGADSVRGQVRDFSICTKSFSGADGRIEKLHGVRLNWTREPSGRMCMSEIGGSEFSMPCDLCFLALGFVHPEHDGIVKLLQLETDSRGNVKTDANYLTTTPHVFCAGDMRRGQSLVVWAIAEGRRAAHCVDVSLMGRSELPS